MNKLRNPREYTKGDQIVALITSEVLFDTAPTHGISRAAELSSAALMLPSKIPSYFKARRDRLMKAHPGAVFIFPSNQELIRNSDVTFPFRQESNFYYLSGFDEPESVLVLAPKTAGTGDYRTILFVRRRDPNKEMWEGERYGVDGARQVFGADEAYVIDEFQKKLPDLLQGADRVFYRIGLNKASDEKVIPALDAFRAAAGRTGRALLTIADPGEPIGEMRLFKSPEEIEAMRKAAKITALAHKTAMKEVRPGMNEYEVEALVDYVFRKNGCQRVGYGTIIAGGVNAACLHYRFNNQPLKDGELILIDAGGEFDFYSADITRTFPIGKEFTPAQAKVYDLVLKAEKEAIAMTKPGVTIPAIHQHCCEVITDGLLSLGLLNGNRAEILAQSGFTRFFPHRTSHFLGMDVHDVGLYLKDGQPRPLEAGMVFTIEPGFYVQPGDAACPAEYHKIGIRIEDDVLVTPTGCENLTIDAPKERSEIEALKR